MAKNVSITFGSGVGGTGVSKAALEQARKTGVLNLISREITEISEDILNVNTPPASDSPIDFNKPRDFYFQIVTKLNLTSNSIKEIPDNIGVLDTLTVLDISGNQVHTVSPNISKLILLQSLSLSANSLTELPTELSKLTNLTLLKLENNKLTHIGDWINGLASLQNLNLQRNLLIAITPLIASLVKLRNLEINENKLEELPNEIGQLPNLIEFTCSKNKLEKVPDLSGLVKLQRFDISMNRITEFPIFAKNDSLKEVICSNNRIESFPVGCLKGLVGLSVLIINFNNLTVLTEEITELSGLQRLDCSNNSITSVPYTLGRMRLNQLLLAGNLLRDIRQDLLTKGTSELLSYLASKIPNEDEGATANVVSKSYSGLDPALEFVKDGKFLKLNQQGLTELPPAVLSGNLCGDVIDVDVTKNKLKSIPDTFFNAFRKATALHMQFNQFSALPLGVVLMQGLTVLEIMNNRLSELPPEFVQLTKLQDIRIAFNNFAEVPPVLYGMENLTAIAASNNEIRKIETEQFRQMGNLVTLDLSNNEIGFVPPQIALCEKLRSLNLMGNTFKVPSQQILDKGSIALLEYLKGRIPT